MEKKETTLFGYVAEFDNSDALLNAAKKIGESGYTATDAYSPIPVHGVYEALGGKRSIITWMVFVAGLCGALAGFGLQYWVSVIEYPINVGGRPYFSWPSFIPITFECMILFAAMTAVFGMFILNGLPLPYHPIFNTPNFEKASLDHYFISIESTDEKFNEQEVEAFLWSLNPLNVSRVES